LTVKRTTRHPIARERFGELARPAIGLPVSHTWRGFGSAIFLELGRLRPAPALRATPPGRRPPNPRGEFGVMIEWSWRVDRARSIEAGSWSTERRIESAHSTFGTWIAFHRATARRIQAAGRKRLM